MSKFTFILLLSFSITSVAREKPHAPEELLGANIVSAEEVVELILSRPGMVLIDSRKRTEYIKGHIEGAVNILNTDITLDKLQSVAPDRGVALLFYCNGIRCMRSADSIKKAVNWGYTNIYWFRDGWRVWAEKKFPVVID